jgi:hypothetical protein
MRTIQMVSDEDGERLQRFEEMRQGKIKSLLAGAVITDVIFEGGFGIGGKGISGLVMEKDGKMFGVSIDTHQFYEVTETRLDISAEGKEIERMITMPTPCDTCTKKDCKTRSTPDGWVVKCGDAVSS